MQGTDWTNLRSPFRKPLNRNPNKWPLKVQLSSFWYTASNPLPQIEEFWCVNLVPWSSSLILRYWDTTSERQLWKEKKEKGKPIKRTDWAVLAFITSFRNKSFVNTSQIKLLLYTLTWFLTFSNPGHKILSLAGHKAVFSSTSNHLHLVQLLLPPRE